MDLYLEVDSYSFPRFMAFPREVHFFNYGFPIHCISSLQ